MGQPVVHSRSSARTGPSCRATTPSSSAGQIDASNPLGYGTVARDGNTNAEGVGIGGGIAKGPTPDYAGHVTFYVEVPDVEAALAKAESLGGTRVFGPGKVPGTDVELGQFTDPEGHLIGLTRAAS
jgi:hypothetical protein